MLKLVPVDSVFVVVPTLPVIKMLFPMARSPVRLPAMVARPDEFEAELMI